MDGMRTGRRARRSIAAYVDDSSAEQLPQTRLDVGPCAHVRRFFLRPDQLFRFAERAVDRCQLLFVQRIKLLHADDGGVLDLLRLAIIEEIEVDLAGAKNNALGRLR